MAWTRTTSPVSGALMTSPPPTYMPTWLMPPKPQKRRSPGWRSERGIWGMASYWAAAVRGRSTPAWRQAHCVSPEQSKPPPGLSPPHTYGTPIWLSAAATAVAAPPDAGRLGRTTGREGPEGSLLRAGPLVLAAAAAAAAASRARKAAWEAA